MKKLYYIFTILFIFFWGVSCIDLDSEFSGVIDPDNFPVTDKDADALVIGCYVPFQSNWYNGIFTVNKQGYQVIGDLTTDIGDCIWGDDWQLAIYQNWTPDSWIVTFFYEYIRDMNESTMVLNQLEQMNLDEDKKRRSVAEVKCARAFMAYLLYSWFGPVPVPTVEELQNPQSNIAIPRLSEEEIVEFIEKDLIDAAVDLGYPSDVEWGRFTKGLSKTLLLKLYMLDQQWDKAEAVGRELLDARYGYTLVPSYKDIFTFENQKNNEIIFASTCDQTISQLWLAHVLPGAYPTNNPNIVKWNGYRVPWQFYDTFEDNDQRLEVLVGEFRGNDGMLYNRNNPGNALGKGAIPMKYGEDPGTIGEESSIDWIVYRYADVITLLAEAIVRNNNSVTQEAVDLLNQIRERAGLSAYSLSRYTNTDIFFNDVLLERGHEFWFEGLRREDLIRHGKYKEKAIEKGSVTAQDWFNRMPLPQYVITEGRGQIIQNPNY